MPAIHISGGGENASVSAQIPIGPVLIPGLFIRTPPGYVVAVCDGDPLRLPARQRVSRLPHARRIEECVVKEPFIRLLGQFFDYGSEQAIPRVGVLVYIWNSA